MKIKTVEQLDANDFETCLDKKPKTTDLHPDELDLLIAYRVMNELGKSALIKVRWTLPERRRCEISVSGGYKPPDA